MVKKIFSILEAIVGIYCSVILVIGMQNRDPEMPEEEVITLVIGVLVITIATIIGLNFDQLEEKIKNHTKRSR